MNTSTPAKSFSPPQEAGRIFNGSLPADSFTPNDISDFDPSFFDTYQPEPKLAAKPETRTQTLNASEQLGIWKDAPTDIGERVGLHGVTLYDSYEAKTKKRLEHIRSELPEQQPAENVESFASALQKTQTAENAPLNLTEEKWKQIRIQRIREHEEQIRAIIRQDERKANVSGRKATVETHTNQRATSLDLSWGTLLKATLADIGLTQKLEESQRAAQRAHKQQAARGGNTGLEGGSERRSDAIAVMQERKLAQVVAAHEWPQGE